MTDADLHAVWDAVHDATSPGWHVGRPNLHDERRQWEQYAFDPSERPRVGLRSREWTAVARTEVGVLREMARCLRELGQGGCRASPDRLDDHRVVGSTIL